MIVELLLSAVKLLLTGMLLLFPDVPMPFASERAQFASFVGGRLGLINTAFPIDSALLVVTWTLTYVLPILVTFIIVRWIYAHLPVVGSG